MEPGSVAGAVCASINPDPRGSADINANSRREGTFFINDVVWLVLCGAGSRAPRGEAHESAGSLEARGATAREPGGASLHNGMTGHGPDAATFERARSADTGVPEHITDTMAFMFETRALIRPAPHALALPQRQHDYARCWQGLAKRFTPHARDAR